MNRTFLTSTQLALVTGLVATGLALGALAEDYGKIKVVHDPAVAARTNMPRSPDDSSELKVTFDPEVAARTNMKRGPNDVGTVTSAPDMALRARTNMGGIAKQPSEPPKTAAAKQ